MNETEQSSPALGWRERFEILTAASRVRALHGAPLAVLGVIATRANRETWCWRMSPKTIAAEACVPLRTVHAAMAKLIDAGFVIVERRHRAASTYRLSAAGCTQGQDHRALCAVDDTQGGLSAADCVQPSAGLSAADCADRVQPAAHLKATVTTAHLETHPEQSMRAARCAQVLRDRGYRITSTAASIQEAVAAGVTPEQLVEIAETWPEKAPAYWLAKVKGQLEDLRRAREQATAGAPAPDSGPCEIDL